MRARRGSRRETGCGRPTSSSTSPRSRSTSKIPSAATHSCAMPGSVSGCSVSNPRIDAGFRHRRETGMLFNRSITTQFTIAFVVALLLVVGSFYLVLDSVYRNELKSQAETVADNVDAFGSWVSQYGRVWVRDDNKSYLGQVTLVSAPDAAGGPAAADVWHFYSKNPALAQREFSEVVEKSASPAKFRVTSHNFMNPVNKPDAFEAKALQRIRAQHLAEYYEMSPDSFRFARTLYVKASCLACHASAENAPADVKTRYGTERGFGFKEGEVAGIISVRLPVRSFWKVTTDVVGPLQIALLVSVFVVAMLFYRVS